MGARGRKAYRDRTAGGVMPLKDIASRLGVSPRTVWSDYQSALEKLRNTPGAFAGMLAMLAPRPELLRAGSIECRRDWIELHGERG
jgi:hypothetical protein